MTEDTQTLVSAFLRIGQPEIAEKLQHFSAPQRVYIVAKYRYEKLSDHYHAEIDAIVEQYEGDELVQRLDECKPHQELVTAGEIYSKARKVLLEWAREKMLSASRKLGRYQGDKLNMDYLWSNMNPEIEEKLVAIALNLPNDEADSVQN